MADTFLNLSSISRYKDTPVYLEGGVLEFALWEPPAEFGPQEAGARIHRVRSNEIGFLDLITVRYYGRGYERAWWVIAQANSIVDPERDMYVGQPLVIPPRALLTRYLSRPGNGA